MASLLTVSNQFIADWIGLPEKTIIMPSVIDCRSIPERNYTHKKGKVIIGWTGQAYQLDFIRPLFPVLDNLVKRGTVEVWFFTSSIKNKDDIDDINKAGVKIIQFSEEKEYEILQQIDIGLMPMPQSVFDLGKFPLKLIKYMAAGASVVCSPVGSNMEIIEEGVHGYFACGPDEWYEKIIQLINDKDMRVAMGKRGRKKVEEYYSVESNWPRLKKSLNNILKER